MSNVFANGSTIIIDAVTASSVRECQDIIEAVPYPTGEPIGRLRHFLAMHGDTENAAIALPGTWGVYPQDACSDGEDGGFTGLTFGDLRAILDFLAHAR